MEEENHVGVGSGGGKFHVLTTFTIHFMFDIYKGLTYRRPPF